MPKVIIVSWLNPQEIVNCFDLYNPTMNTIQTRYIDTGIILCMPRANERRRHIVTWSLIGWAHSQNTPCR